MKKWLKGRFWEKYSSEELQALEDEIFNGLRSEGFPLSNHTFEERLCDFNNLVRSGDKPIISNDRTIRQTMLGLRAVWHYFPHHIKVKCGKLLSPYDAFMDDTLLRKAIRYRLKRGGYLTGNGMRKSIKIVSGCQSVSNFRPSAAKGIYEKYGGGTVWDMSCGYGGRLIAAMASKSVKRYIGCEPNPDTFKGLLELEKEFGAYSDTAVEIHQIGCEDFVPDKVVDICFTSPPYFNHEKYGDESTQSYIRYPTPERWMKEFIGKMVDNVSKCLKTGGWFLLNIAAVPSYPSLTDDFHKLMVVRNDFDRHEPLKLLLSAMPSRKLSGTMGKSEPVFVYQRRAI